MRLKPLLSTRAWAVGKPLGGTLRDVAAGRHLAGRYLNPLEHPRVVRAWKRLNLDVWGFLLGALMFTAALTPSLLPRSFVYQGVVCGLSAATGHVVGLMLHWNWRAWFYDVASLLGWKIRRSMHTSVHLPVRWKRVPVGRNTVEMVLAGGFTFAIFYTFVRAITWQRELAHVMGVHAEPLVKSLLILPIGLGLWLALGLIGRALYFATSQATRISPWPLSVQVRTAVAWLLAVVLSVVIVDTVIPGTVVRVSERVFSVRNNQFREDLTPPTLAERSGSPQSLNDWEGLGAYGSRFVSLGLHKNELQQLTGRPAQEPIRVFSGLSHGESAKERADRLVAELERTGAKDRDAVMIAGSTGTGWINPTAAQAFEMLFDGNTAIAGTQYSYLPSPIQFIASQDEVRESGREMVTAVLDWWNALPADDRPELYVFGESLGTTQGEGAFSGMRDIANSVDGIVWVGPPNANPLWRTLEDRRDPGTPEIAPEYAGGSLVRFAQNRDEIDRLLTSPTAWGPPRVLYVQHPSDPIVWWSPRLILEEPDWLKEQPGFDRHPSMRWWPFVTFWQVSLDLPNSVNVPDGHGHNYGTAVLDGLVAVTGKDVDRERYRSLLKIAMLGQGPEKDNVRQLD